MNYLFILPVIKILKLNNLEKLKWIEKAVLDNSKQVYFEYNGWLYALEGE